jgi:hypothetical protein
LPCQDAISAVPAGGPARGCDDYGLQGLLECLQTVPEPRRRCGIRHRAAGPAVAAHVPAGAGPAGCSGRGRRVRRLAEKPGDGRAGGRRGARSAGGVLDTSVVIALREIADPSLLPVEPLITTVTLAELSAGPLVARDERERAARQAHLQQAEADFDPLPFDRASARAFGQVAASLRRSGR